jgi:DNA-binding response OmpR family regulator
VRLAKHHTQRTVTPERPSEIRNGKVDRPAVLLLTDDPNIARAIGMLLRDWGFEGRAADSVGVESDAPGSQIKVAGILVDLLTARTAHALDHALALRARVGEQVPILIQANNGSPSDSVPSAKHVTILSKPVDPGRIRVWLTADRPV